MSTRLFAILFVQVAASTVWAGPIAYLPNGKTLLATDVDGTLRLYSPPNTQEPTILHAHKGAIFDLAISADGKRVLTAGADGCVRVWDPTTWKETATFRGHTGVVRCVTISHDSKLAASGGNDKTARLWDPETGIERLKLEQHPGAVVSVCFSRDGNLLYSAPAAELSRFPGTISSKHSFHVHCWETATGKTSKFPKIVGQTVAASQRMLAIGSEVITARANEKTESFITSQIKATLLSADGTERANVLKCGTGLTFSPDGLFLAVCGTPSENPPTRIAGPGEQTRTVAIVDSFDGTELRAIHGGTRGVAFSPDGLKLAIWSPRGEPLGMTSLKREPRKKVEFDVEVAWTELAGESSQAGFALFELVEHASDAVAIIDRKLKPIVALESASVKQAIADLDHPQFAKREAAAKQLNEAGIQVLPALKAALGSSPSAERRQRLEVIIPAIESDAANPGSESRRRVRAVGVLERIGSLEARALLEKFATGAKSSSFTEAASSALIRLSLREGK